MRKRLAFVTSLLVLAAAVWGPLAPVQAGVVCVGRGCAAPSVIESGGVVAGNLELRDLTDLAAESLTNPNLTAGTSWTQTGDFALAADAATYTHSTGSGSFQQTSAAGAIPWATLGINGWFVITYTTSGITGTAPSCNVPNTFALATQTLTVSPAGTYTVSFKAMATTVGDYKIACTSAAAGTVTFDTLSLKRVIGGDLTVSGRLFVNSGTSAVPGITSIEDTTTGLFLQTNAFAMVVSGAPRIAVQTNNMYPSTNDSLALGQTTLLFSNLYQSRSTQGSKTKALTETVATAVTQIAVPQTAGSNHADATIQWSVYATDATDTQLRRGSTYLAAVNKAGTETCTVSDIGTTTVAVSVGTLTCTTSCITGLTDVVQFALNCSSSLTQTTLNALVRADMMQINTLTPQ